MSMRVRSEQLVWFLYLLSKSVILNHLADTVNIDLSVGIRKKSITQEKKVFK